MQSISYYFHNPRKLGLRLLVRFGSWLPDKAFLKCKFRLAMGYKLDLKNPKSFSEKLQWLKLYDRRPEYTTMVDKVKAKEYVSSVIGKEYIIPTLGVWADPDEISFYNLPNRFVLKVNHNSGTGMYICKDKNTMDIEKVKAGLRKGLKENFYMINREWPYKDVQRRIIAEKYMEDDYGELRDYKFFCFDGVVKAMFIAKDRSKGEDAVRFDFFDADFNHLPFTNGHPNAEILPEKPKKFEEMKQLASKLSKGIPHVRIDFFEVGDKVFFGEMTFFHWGGTMPFDPVEWDYVFGQWIILPTKRT